MVAASASYVGLPGLEAMLALWFAALGAVVGSFLNVVVWRLPQGISLATPGSHCPRCGAPIAAHDNIPVLAWLVLRGRCRTCRGPISLRYPLVEACTAVVTVLFVRHDGLSLALPFHLVFAWALIALALIDLDTWLLPFRISLPLIPLGILAGLAESKSAGLNAAIGAGIGWSLIVFVGFVGEMVLKKEAMGGGDSYLMASIGAFCGPLLLWVALFLASIQGVVYGLVRLRQRPQSVPLVPSEPVPALPEVLTPTTAPSAESGDDDDWVPDPHAVPFGPFLALGAIETLLWGQGLNHWVPTISLSWLGR